jgi:hypothetical protein
MSALLALAGSPALAEGNPNPGIVPSQAHPGGKTYGEWSAAWWQWALSIPADRNPLTDVTGEFAGVGQSGPVFFMVGTFAASAERTITVPLGKHLFLPVHVWIFGAIAGDCDPSAPGVACDVPTLQASAAAAANAATVMDVIIDGRLVQDVRDYHAVSPGGFDVTLPSNAVLGLPEGTFGPHVADGFWLMLKPLEPGSHLMTLHVVNPVYGLDYSLVYHITAAP